jgi:hypothetical protein
MSESPGTARTAISLSRDLKQRMDAVEVSVNWSAVAAEAFEAKLVELASKMETKNMEDVIARMKAAEELDSQETYQQGHKDGEEWARQEARPKALRRLESLMAQQDDILGVWDNGMNSGIAWHLYQYLNPSLEVNRFDVKVFWESVLGENGHETISDYSYAKGFIEGTLEVWEQVQSKL